MLTYLLLLFTCASAILLRQGPTDSNHSPWPYDIGLQNKGHKPIVGNKPFHQPIIRLGGGLSHARLPPQDHWDKELIAKLLPIMTEKPEPYLAYLDFWRLKKGRKSNNYEEEKNRFMNFVETVNRNLEHGMKAALEKKPEEAASSSSFNNPYGMPELAGITRNDPEQNLQTDPNDITARIGLIVPNPHANTRNSAWLSSLDRDRPGAQRILDAQKHQLAGANRKDKI